MNIKLPTKEVFTSFVDWAKSMPKFFQAFVILVLLVFGGYYVARSEIQQVISAEFKERDIELELQKERQKFMDSINKIRARHFWKQSLNDELEIRDICEDIERYFENETHVTLFKLHDHGDPLAPENNPMVTVKWSSLSEIQTNYQEEPVYTGALWIIRETLNYHFTYMPNIEEQPKYFVGRERAFHKSLGSKSAAFIYIKETESSRWFLAVHWRNKEPYESTYNLQIQMQRFANLLEPLIYDVPPELRN